MFVKNLLVKVTVYYLKNYTIEFKTFRTDFFFIEEPLFIGNSINYKIYLQD